MSIEEQILRLDIPMSDTLPVQIRNASDNLLEAALDLGRTHTTLLDGSIQVTTRTELHDFTPVMIVVLNEVHSFHDINMMQSRRDAKFGSELLHIFLLSFILSSLSKFLDCTEESTSLGNIILGRHSP